LSLIADSLKKAVKEKSFDVGPGINLLKNLGDKSSSKLNAKEVKRFVILIVLPATILAYLLLANPFGPKKKSRQISAPVVAKAPRVAPKQPAPPTPAPMKTVPAKKADTAPVIEPGMKQIPVLEDDAKAAQPKQVPGPKKKSSAEITAIPTPARVTKTMPLAQKKPSAKINKPEKSVTKIPAKREKAKTEPPKQIKLIEPAKIPETFVRRPPAPQTDELSFPTIPEPDIFKNSDFYFNRAIFYQQSRSWEKALTNYSKAAELDPNNPDIYNNIGVIYKELRQYDRAIEEFLRAIYLNPAYAKPYNNIGVVYYAKKDFPGAIRNYQKAVSINPKNLEALNNLAVAYKRIDLPEKAKAVLNQALKINLAHAGTHYNLAVLYEEEGNFKSAIHFYRRFVELGSTSHSALSMKVKKHIETLR